jgi:hypothetical protein
MPEDFTLLQLHDLFVVRMQVATTNCRTCYLVDDVFWFSDGRHGDFFNSNVSGAMPTKCKQGFILTVFGFVGSDGGPVTDLLFNLVGDKGFRDCGFLTKFSGYAMKERMNTKGTFDKTDAR